MNDENSQTPIVPADEYAERDPHPSPLPGGRGDARKDEDTSDSDLHLFEHHFALKV
jgi:hypothetical protein